MQIAFFIYDGFTSLDAVGPFDVLSRLPGAQAVFVGQERRAYHNDNNSLHLVAKKTLDEVTRPDILVVPGGTAGTRAAAANPQITQWVAAVHEHTQWTTSVCTGSLILGAAGLLNGLSATTHWAAQGELAGVGASYQASRWVQEGKIITAAGVSAGIDMALFVAGEVAGEVTAQAIQLGIEYDPAPPFDAGAVAKASPEVLQAVAGVFT